MGRQDQIQEAALPTLQTLSLATDVLGAASETHRTTPLNPKTC